jgi:hypothetical protein
MNGSPSATHTGFAACLVQAAARAAHGYAVMILDEQDLLGVAPVALGRLRDNAW